MKVVVGGREGTISDAPFQDTTPALFSDGVPTARKYACVRCGLHKPAPVYRLVVPGVLNGLACGSCRNRLLQAAGQSPAPVARSHRRGPSVRVISAVVIVALLISAGVAVASFNLAGTSSASAHSSSAASSSTTSAMNTASSTSDTITTATSSSSSITTVATFVKAPTIIVPGTAGDTAGSCSFTPATFTCTGTNITAGEAYTVTATIGNPEASPEAMSFTASVTAGWTVAPEGGSFTLTPGNSTMTWTITSPAGGASSTNFQVSLTG